MKDEIRRRLKAMGLSDNIINGRDIPCFIEGKLSKLTNRDKTALKELEERGINVYCAIHDYYDGVPMDNYLVISDEAHEWPYEFREVDDKYISVYAFVMSPLTHGLFDGGYIYVKHDNSSGHVSRVTDIEE